MNYKILRKTVSLLLSIMLIYSLFTMTASAATGKDLKYSTYISTPSNYAKQNCYGYALGIPVDVNPGYYSGRTYKNADGFILAVRADLKALGYDIRTVSGPYVSLQSGERLIAFYYGGWASESWKVGSTDNFFVDTTYHFWRRDNSLWYHKYGTNSGIMRANWAPSTANIGTICNEYYNGITGKFNRATMFAGYSDAGGICFQYIAIKNTGRVASTNSMKGQLELQHNTYPVEVF